MTLDELFAADLPVLVQGITGRQGQAHAKLMRAYGTHIVGGVSPSGGEVDGLPVFADCAQAVAATGARASVIMVPAMQVLDAVQDALAAGIGLVVCLTEGIPVHDAVAMSARARRNGALLVGGSTPGLAIPGRLKLGFLPDVSLRPGPLGVMSKSGTLSYETCFRLARLGIGQSLWLGVGGDAVKGFRFADAVPFFAGHEATRAVVIIGEIGGTEEEEFAEALVRQSFGKPVFALIAGSSAPAGVTMGHAGALITGGRGSVGSKRRALEAAGVRVFTSLAPLARAVGEHFGGPHGAD